MKFYIQIGPFLVHPLYKNGFINSDFMRVEENFGNRKLESKHVAAHRAPLTIVDAFNH